MVNLPNRKTAPIAEFARITGVSIDTAKKIIQEFPAARVKGKPSLAFAESLAARPRNNFLMTDELILRVAVNPFELGGSMYLNDAVSLAHISATRPGEIGARKTDINRWNRIACEKGFRFPSEKVLYYSGFWKCDDEIRDRLVEENGLIISTCGGYVHQVARVVEWMENIHYQRRKVFLVEPLSEAESAKFMIRVDKQAQQTPDVFNR